MKKQQDTIVEIVADLDDREAAEPLLDTLRSLASRKQRPRQAREIVEVQQRERQTTKGRQIGPITIRRNVAALDTASDAGKREALAALGIRAVVYGRDDDKSVAPPNTRQVTIIGNS